MGAPSTLTTTWPQWQSATVGPACQPNLTTTPQSATSGTFTVPTNTPVGVWIENLCWVSGNEYLWAEVTLPTTGDVFNVPSGITVSSTDAGIVGNTWTGSTVQPHPALVPTPYVPIPGGILTLDLNNGNAGDTGAFAVSQQLQSAQTCFAPLFCVALEQPIPLGQATANATGTASLALPIPVGISPGRYYLQAAWTTGALTGWRSSEVLIIDL